MSNTVLLKENVSFSQLLIFYTHCIFDIAFPEDLLLLPPKRPPT